MSYASRPVDVPVAARNNAAWCDAVCRTHGSPGVFADEVWTVPRRSPQFYPDAITLDPNVTADRFLPRIDTTPGCSVKDSFGTLDLAPFGFGVLFEATWICLEAGSRATDDGRVRWAAARDAREVQEWATAWAEPGVASPFRPELLEVPDVAILAERDPTHVVAGAVLNRAAGVVGLSNLFTTNGDLDGAWNGAVAAARELFPDEAIVGYESGADLDAARRRGFVPLGPLRVWVNDGL
jgi:hypothetical protein